MKCRDREFNRGKTLIRMAYSIPNLCWFVWRDDNGHVSQQMLKTHQTIEAAIADYDRRCDFLAKIEEKEAQK